MRSFLAVTTVFVATATAGVAGDRYVSDNVLRVPLRDRWSGSVGFGVSNGQQAAYILVGNFHFPGNYASTHEGAPPVPPRRFLISLGDFPLSAFSLHWRHVYHLGLPRRRRHAKSVSWRVRFAGRAVWLNVQFGSMPDARDRALVNAVLASITPVR
jgi:hypothetical protein